MGGRDQKYKEMGEVIYGWPPSLFSPSAQQNFTTQEMEQQQMCVPIDLTVVLYICTLAFKV